MAKISQEAKQSMRDTPDDEFVPAGEYLAEIIKSENKDTKAGDGSYLSLQFKIVEGQHKGEVVYTNLNLVNKSEVAVKIACKSLKKICECVNINYEKMDDSQELHNRPLIIVVSMRDPDSAYPGNEIKNYKPAGGSASTGGIKKNPFGTKKPA